MGMDFEEICMRIEVVFHLRIDGEFYQSMIESVTQESPGSELSPGLKRADDLTVGQLVDEIVSRLKLAGWYEKQRTLDATLEELLHKLRTHYGRQDITPDTLVENILIPKPNGLDWTEFTQLFPVLLPDLIWVGFQINPSLAVILSSVVAGIVIGVLSESLIWAVFASALIAIITLNASLFHNQLHRQNPMNRRIPEEIHTVQRLAEFVHRSQTGEGMTVPWNAETVWTAVQSILADVLSVPIEKVTQEARLVHDLGMS